MVEEDSDVEVSLRQRNALTERTPVKQADATSATASKPLTERTPSKAATSSESETEKENAEPQQQQQPPNAHPVEIVVEIEKSKADEVDANKAHLCGNCTAPVLDSDDGMFCESCHDWFHIGGACQEMTSTLYKALKGKRNRGKNVEYVQSVWICRHCVSEVKQYLSVPIRDRRRHDNAQPSCSSEERSSSTMPLPDADAPADAVGGTAGTHRSIGHTTEEQTRDVKVRSVQGRDDPLSNFSDMGTGEMFEFEGENFKTVEHCYHYGKIDHNGGSEELKRAVREAHTPGAAKREAKKVGALSKSWDKVGEQLMRRLLRAKFDQCPKMRIALLESNSDMIAHSIPFPTPGTKDKWSTWLNDLNTKCCSNGRFPGPNLHGVMLMELRSEKSKELQALGTAREAAKLEEAAAAHVEKEATADAGRQHGRDHSYARHSVDQRQTPGPQQMQQDPRGSNHGSQRNHWQQRLKERREHQACHRCGRLGHVIQECKKPADWLCYRCNKPGHLTRACKSEAAGRIDEQAARAWYRRQQRPHDQTSARTRAADSQRQQDSGTVLAAAAPSTSQDHTRRQPPTMHQGTAQLPTTQPPPTQPQMFQNQQPVAQELYSHALMPPEAQAANGGRADTDLREMVVTILQRLLGLAEDVEALKERSNNPIAMHPHPGSGRVAAP
jgi:ribA/ribD-fused uncharacterized protein